MMSPFHKISGLLRSVTAVLIVSAGIADGQVTSEMPGPAVGARAPAFQLFDQTGARRSIDSAMGPKGLMLVFFRSADW
jgi:hypothetical protein